MNNHYILGQKPCQNNAQIMRNGVLCTNEKFVSRKPVATDLANEESFAPDPVLRIRSQSECPVLLQGMSGRH